jgi:Ataxin-3
MATTRFEEDPGDGHWFNLNSFEPQPKWIGKLYLDLVLQQAEAEGWLILFGWLDPPDAQDNYRLFGFCSSSNRLR